MASDTEWQRQVANEIPGDQVGDEGCRNHQVGDHQTTSMAGQGNDRRNGDRSSRVITTSAVSSARSDPARPIATPTVAAAMAGRR